MLPIRKPFAIDPIFPFELVHRGVRYSDNELPDHLHDLYEIVYVHAGSGTLFIDDALYEQAPGYLFVIPGNTVHRAFPSAADPVVSTAVFFAPSLVQAEPLDDGYEPLRSFDAARRKKQYAIALPDAMRQTVESAMDAMAFELRSREAGCRHAIRLQLQRLLLDLSRLPYAQEPAAARHRIGPPWIQAALRAIDRDPVACGGLAELSGRACVSAAHFARVFKQLTGLNVTDYVNAKRLVRAKDMLLTTDDNIETIALACGYQGLPYFYQTFRKLTGLTPRAFRRQAK